MRIRKIVLFLSVMSFGSLILSGANFSMVRRRVDIVAQAVVFATFFKKKITDVALAAAMQARDAGKTDVPSDDEFLSCYEVLEFCSEEDVTRLSTVPTGAKKTIIGVVVNPETVQTAAFLDAIKKLSLEGVFFLVFPSCSAWTAAVTATSFVRGESGLVVALNKSARKTVVVVLEQPAPSDSFDCDVDALAVATPEAESRSPLLCKTYELTFGVHEFILMREAKTSLALKVSSRSSVTVCEEEESVLDADLEMSDAEFLAKRAVDLIMGQDESVSSKDIPIHALQQSLKK